MSINGAIFAARDGGGVGAAGSPGCGSVQRTAGNVDRACANNNVVEVQDSCAAVAEEGPLGAAGAARAEQRSGEAGSTVVLRSVKGRQGWTVGAEDSSAGGSSADDTVAQLARCLARIEVELLAEGLDWGDAYLVSLYLKDMTHFAEVNRVYKQYLPAVSPPARCCVQEGGEKKDAGGGEALMQQEVENWVQGGMFQLRRSMQLPAWAEGWRWTLVTRTLQDSQTGAARPVHLELGSILHRTICAGDVHTAIETTAVAAGGILHMAGQIGLDPATMELVQGGVPEQCRRALHSAEEVARVMRGAVSRNFLGMTIYTTTEGGSKALRDARQALFAHMDEKVDPPTRQLPLPPTYVVGDEGPEKEERADEEGTDEAYWGWRGWGTKKLPNPRYNSPSFYPNITYVVVDALPKGSLVEVQPLTYLDPLGELSDDEEEDDDGSSSSDSSEGGGAEITEARMLQRLQLQGWGKHCQASRTESNKGGGESVMWLGCFLIAKAFVHIACKGLEAIKKELNQAVEKHLDNGLEATGLTWLDVTSMRVYYVPELMDRSSVELLLLDIMSTREIPPHQLSPVLVPVIAVGTCEKVTSQIVIELLTVPSNPCDRV
ncbi:hypothetical protein CYMTET_18703 [Cymbomonas tetramitiformis]|uniref:Uncharacterized protein n=1 Tax=Cymbomonas tetramitiformis TaxID=36881 RepID=A0AAE0L625_9CHLO|nr:hypothetical protein CYMTET_18703 [Cymbomonas tetramitiformis]